MATKPIFAVTCLVLGQFQEIEFEIVKGFESDKDAEDFMQEWKGQDPTRVGWCIHEFDVEFFNRE